MKDGNPYEPNASGARLGDDARALVRTIRERLSVRDRDGVVNAGLEAVDSRRIGIADLYTQVLGPLMTGIGLSWQEGEIRVWEEHFATQSVRDLVDALAPRVLAASAAATPVAKRVLMACPPGEQHDLGLRMLADRFRLAGWDVFYLGTDTPLEEISEAARTLDVDLLVLSASTHFNRTLLRSVVRRLRKELPGRRIGVGGPAFTRDKDWPADELLDPVALGLPGSPPAENAPDQRR
jgi:methanogenic corrinoid protein MtbC1